MREARRLLEELKRGLTKDPTFHYLAALLKLQSRKRNQKTLQAVIQDFNRALHLDPENSYIRHSFESTILEHRHFNSAAALRTKLAGYHIKELNSQRRKYRHDRMRSHLHRVLYLDPLSPLSLKIHLQVLKAKQDYEGLLAVYHRLLKQLPNDFKLRHRLDRAFQEREKNIAYREKLFNPVLSTEKATFKRSTKGIFTFSIKSQDFLTEYPDLSERIGQAINTELNQAGPLKGIKESTRNKVIEYMRALEARTHSVTPWGILYNSRYINHLHHALREEEEEVHYFLSGEYRNTPSRVIHASIQLRESNTGTSIAQFHFKTRAKNSILDLAQKVREAILEHIPIEGELIKVKGKKLFVNLGSYDGVKKKRYFTAPSLSVKRNAFQVEEVGAYVSRIKALEGFQRQRLYKGLALRLIRDKKERK